MFGKLFGNKPEAAKAAPVNVENAREKLES